MKKNRLILLLGITIAALIVGFALLFKGTKSNYQWRESYDERKIDPYGTQILFGLLEDLFPKDSIQVITQNLVTKLPDDVQGANYVFVGSNLFMTAEDTDALLDFVANGNHALLSTNEIPYDLMFQLLDSTCYESWWEQYEQFNANSVLLNLEHPDLKLDKAILLTLYQQNGKTKNTDWSYIPSAFFCDEAYSPATLGYVNNNLVNFARFPYEAGAFYLHTTPLAMTNLGLLKSENLQYVENVFAHLLDGPIYWDRYSRLPSLPRSPSTPPGGETNRLSKDSPFQYVLSQPALAWAWYVTLALALLYVIFRAKRQQPVIPILAANENTSLAFVQTIGRLYFLQNNHKKLAVAQMQLFLSRIREQYGLNLTRLDEQSIPTLALRMGVPEPKLRQIAKMYDQIEQRPTISSDTLIEFYQLLEPFEL